MEILPLWLSACVPMIQYRNSNDYSLPQTPLLIMQAPKEVPVDLTCKDKFLIQNTIVPEGTGEENITSEMFSRENGKYIEESKLRVILGTPPPRRSQSCHPSTEHKSRHCQ